MRARYLLRDRLEVVRGLDGRPVAARKGAYPRATMGFARLPKRYRREIAAAARKADDEARRERLRDQGVEVPSGDVWT